MHAVGDHGGPCLAAIEVELLSNCQIEAIEASLNNRRTKLAMQYVVKFNTNALNPAYNCIVETHDESRPNYIRPHIEALGLDLDVLDDTKVPEHSPWLLSNTPTHGIEDVCLFVCCCFTS